VVGHLGTRSVGRRVQRRDPVAHVTCGQRGHASQLSPAQDADGGPGRHDLDRLYGLTCRTWWRWYPGVHVSSWFSSTSRATRARRSLRRSRLAGYPLAGVAAAGTPALAAPAGPAAM